jgi:hypothetical protein
MTYTITIHDIKSLRPELIVGPGRDIPNKAKTLKGAMRLMEKRLDGSLGRAPENMGRIAYDGAEAWFFKGEKRSQSGRYITRSITLCQHRAEPPKVTP